MRCHLSDHLEFNSFNFDPKLSTATFFKLERPGSPSLKICHVDLRGLFEEALRFKLEVCRIPSHNSVDYFQSKLFEYKEKLSNPDNLFIVAYNGHAKVDQYLRLKISCGSDYQSGRATRTLGEVDWSSIQYMLLSMRSDILIITHSCEAVGAAMISDIQNITGRKELIASYGYPGKSWDDEFNKVLVESLKGLAPLESFTTANLYQKMLTISLDKAEAFKESRVLARMKR
ncbi:hypothetical protein G7Y89_g1435 [Cudoniella acicularis]|uniref:Uncharacterized protein n=1 Tax=Cudoniella acicularis TaxID=354080 RepID=A0A8H4RVA0_9HELO|nr:hypothetical protein G7Y89_g1435 [Cudoniella acicularis]